MASIWADRVADVWARYREADRLGRDEEMAALLIEASALTLELYEAIAEGVADILRAQRGEDVW